MDVIRNSRKRNHRSPPPSSTFTRSRTQLLLHRNRSGQIRSDPVPKKIKPHSVPVPIQEKPSPDPVPVPVPFDGNNATQRFSDLEYNILVQDICKEYCESDSDDNVLIKDLRKKAKHDDGDLACATTKDLRSRRVYSPLSSAGASSGVIGSVLSDVSVVDSDEKIAELGFGSRSSTQNGVIKPNEVRELGFGSPSSGENGDARVNGGKIQPAEITDLGLICEPQNFDRGNTELSCESPKLQVHKQIGGGNDGDCSEKIDDLGEEPVLTTPPDAVICGNAVNRDARKTEDTLHTEGFSGIKEDGQKNSSVLKSKSVLKPRLPGRLFKAPGSVNYRRLMNIMGADFGIPKLSGQGQGLPLSSDNHEGSKAETVTDSCTMRDTEEVNGECLSMPSVDDKCSSESKVDPTACFCGVGVVGNAFDHGDCKQDSIHQNNLNCAKATNQNGDSEQLDVLNDGCIATTHDNSLLNVDQMQIMPKDACHVKPMDLTKSTQENAIEAFCPKANKRNEPLKSKYVHRPYLNGKLIKSPCSVNYKRLLPYLKNLPKDDSGTSKFADQTYHNKDGANLYAKEFQLPLPSQSEESCMNRKMLVGDLIHDKVDSNALENNFLVNSANMSSHGCRPTLTSSQDFSELPMQLDAKEMVHECLSGPSVQAAHSEKAVISSKEECSSESMTDPCSVMMDFHCAKTVTNGGFNQVHNMISGQHSSEPPPKDQNLLNINDDVPNISFEHHSSNRKGFTINYDEREQFVNMEEHESVSRCPPEGQSPSQLDPNMLGTKESETSGHAICKSDDAVVLSHASISNEKPRPELPEIAAHGGDKAGSLVNGVVYGTKVPSKGSNNKNASFSGDIENGSQSKTTQVLNRCPRMKLFKYAGSFNYKRLLPILLETAKSNSCASNNDHHPKVQKLLDHRPLPISDSNLEVTAESYSDDCGSQQETELQACDSNVDSSSPISQLQDKQIVLNGLYQLQNSTGSPISVHRDLLITPLGPITDEVITREEARPALSTEEKSPETLGCLSKLKVTDQLISPAADFRKGILRRNPRGCRGLCTCLNCASFRLHAERAFEFSRNQLLDAEEVSQDLMKEVSHLRNMLESYTDSVNDTPLLNESQVKEACRKAYETEQLAKDRLSQMNDDLNIHCRTPSLQRPSVKFSVHVEEKIIQSDR